MDVKRAFLHAPALRELYIELPEEAYEDGDPNMVGLLQRAMCGTRDAPLSWQTHVSQYLNELGFEKSKAQPCMLTHRKRDMHVTFHVDDFMAAGLPADLAWFRREMNRRFESTAKMLGPDEGQEARVTFLNRVITWHPDGIRYEADPRHVDTLLRELGMTTAKAASTPGTKDENGNNDDKDIPVHDQNQMRRLVSFLNFISQDRADISFAVKELARNMAAPTEATVRAMKRMLHYLKGQKRCSSVFRWQHQPSELTVYTDSD